LKVLVSIYNGTAWSLAANVKDVPRESRDISHFEQICGKAGATLVASLREHPEPASSGAECVSDIVLPSASQPV
jgi:hypothetical protein